MRLYSKPGIFSWNRLDRAAGLILRALLKDGLPPGSRVLDLGCGNGAIGFGLLHLQPEIELHLADASHAACTAVSISKDRLGYPAQVWFSDVTADVLPDLQFDVIVSNLPRGRALAEQFMREAWERLAPEGRLYIAGAKEIGIRTRMATLEQWFGEVELAGIVPGHRAARLTRREGLHPPPSDYHQWRVLRFEARGRSWSYVTKPGVYSWRRTLDTGTRMLVETMVVRPGECLLDLGCGAGQVGLVGAHLADGVSVVMVDDSLPAVRAAQRTVELNELQRARVLPSDAASAVIGERFDVVATNPPFHVGPGVEYDVAHQFIEDARDVLGPKGRLYLVCNTFIAYERQMQEMFRRVEEVHRDGSFKVLLGARPVGRAKNRPKPPLVAPADGR